MKYDDIFDKGNETVTAFITLTSRNYTRINEMINECMELATEYDYYLDEIKTMPDYILLVYQKYDEEEDDNDNSKHGSLLEESRGISGLKIGKLVKSKLG